MKFTKMQGCGNDYVYINGFEETIAHPEALAVRVSDRHFGIGADGLILLLPSEKADCRMDMYNADGSRGAMCGNGIRCVAKLAYDSGVVRNTQITVETGSGVKTLELTTADGVVIAVRVDMGIPEFCPERIPVDLTKTGAAGGRQGAADGAEQALTVGDDSFFFVPVSMGNPHAVVFLGEAAAGRRAGGDKCGGKTISDAAEALSLEILEIEAIGPRFERHPAFPDRVNTEFAEVIDETTLRMRVWERGSGETLACGTGACAVAVAAMRTGRVSGRSVTVRLRGGDLQITWDAATGHVFMTGPAVTVFTGEIEVED